MNYLVCEHFECKHQSSSLSVTVNIPKVEQAGIKLHESAVGIVNYIDSAISSEWDLSRSMIAYIVFLTNCTTSCSYWVICSHWTMNVLQ